MRKLMKHLVPVLCALTVICAGCALADGAFVPALDPQTACSLTVVGHYSNFEALEAEFNRFSQYYPDVTLRYERLNNYNDVIDVALSGEEAPDIFFVYPSMLGDPYYQDVFALAEDLADPALGLDLSCVQQSVLYADASGKVPYVPVFGETYGMLVNERIFADCGVRIPTTYSGLLEACEALRAAGYAHPIMGYSRDFLLYPLFFPYFCAGIQDDPAALDSLNAMDADAGSHVRDALALAADFMSRGYFDLQTCDETLEKDYEPVILRFFEGDVPMMMAKSSTVSGTAKREAKSAAFSANPFPYSFCPVPSTEQGGYFLDVISMGFAVNSGSDSLAMANEFMRFLISTEELNRIANANRMVPTAAQMSADPVYDAFIALYPERIIYQTTLGLAETPDLQARKAGLLVSRGELSVDEAVAAFGSLK